MCKTKHLRPARIIFDTDMGNDIDDALALVLAHNLQRLGETELLSVVSSKPNPLSARYIDLVNTFYGRGEIPVGETYGEVTPEDGYYLREIVEDRDDCGNLRYPCTHSSYAEAVALLRRQLASAEDGSIELVMTGFSTNMARLLETGPDGHSPLTGHELVRRKVRRVTMMAAHFSEHALANQTLDNREYNIYMDIPSAARWINNCPAPIVFTGLEVGAEVLYPAASILSDYEWAPFHPVVEAYKIFKEMPYDRPVWDLTAILYAVRDGHDYFGLSPKGRAVVDEQGIVRFTPDRQGLHRYLTLDPQQRELVRDALLTLTSKPINRSLVP